MENLAPTAKLYTPTQVGVAALLGAPAAAGWFISRNETQLGRPRYARRWFWGGLVFTVLLLVGSFFLPVHFPRTGLAIGYVVACYQTARQLYATTLQDHRAAGGQFGSWWKVVGVSLLFLVILTVAIFVVAFLLPASVTDRFIPAEP